MGSGMDSAITIEHPVRAARLLEQALLFNFVIHAIAMVSMALCLLPGMPGGLTADVAVRAAYVARHPWLWRLGWFPWQVTALADLWLGMALLATPWIRRWPARLTVLLTAAAIVPDQSGQFLWITRGVQVAQEAVRAGNFAGYLEFESKIFPLVAAWGCLGYLSGALGWTWCFASAGAWSRPLTWLSAATWGVFALSTLAIFLPAAYQPNPLLAAAGNAIGFILLETWLVMVTERVLRRARPDQTWGSCKPWRNPNRGFAGQCVEWLANSRFARLIGEWIGSPALMSDIRDVIYVNYVVEADRLVPLLPWGLELQRLGPDRRFAMFTLLTYRHGHFGPRFLGPLRSRAPSPIQSNWRIYVTDPRSGQSGVHFITNAITSTAYALVARLLSEGVAMHRLAHADVEHHADGTYDQHLDPGNGSAPDLRAHLRPASNRETLPSPFGDCFQTYRDFLAYCVPQDRALAPQPWYRRMARQEIVLGIPLEICEPLEGQIESAAAREIVGGAIPVCFGVPRVKFRFDRAFYDEAE